MGTSPKNEYECAELCLTQMSHIGANMVGCCNFYKAEAYLINNPDFHNTLYETNDEDKVNVTACYFSTVDDNRATLLEKADINNPSNVFLPNDASTFNVDKKYDWLTSFDGEAVVTGGIFNDYGVIETLCTYRGLSMSAVGLKATVAVALASLSIAL